MNARNANGERVQLQHVGNDIIYDRSFILVLLRPSYKSIAVGTTWM